MLAAMEEKEEPRLYSTRYSTAERPDRVPDHQSAIHAELETWARWCWEKWEPKTCDSVEGRHDPGEGGRRVRPPVVSLPENKRLRAIDSVVRNMRMTMPAHGEALRLFYVGESPAEQSERRRRRGLKAWDAMRYSPCPWWAICRALHIHRDAFPAHMATARAALLNLLRRKGV